MLKKFLTEIYHYFLILRSGFFDRNYYLKTYPDVRKADIDPLWLYIRTGWREGRNPSSIFEVSKYLINYPDVAAAQINPIIHYIRHGKDEERNPNPAQSPKIRIFDLDLA